MRDLLAVIWSNTVLKLIIFLVGITLVTVVLFGWRMTGLSQEISQKRGILEQYQDATRSVGEVQQEYQDSYQTALQKLNRLFPFERELIEYMDIIESSARQDGIEVDISVVQNGVGPDNLLAYRALITGDENAFSDFVAILDELELYYEITSVNAQFAPPRDEEEVAAVAQFQITLNIVTR